MTICMAFETNHISIPAMRLETLTRGGLEGRLLLWSIKLVPWEDPSHLSTLTEA